MFIYRPDPIRTYHMFKKKTPGTRWWDTQYHEQMQFCKDMGVSDQSDRMKIVHAYRNFTYISEKKLNEIPMGGFLIPSKFFVCEEKI